MQDEEEELKIMGCGKNRRYSSVLENSSKPIRRDSTASAHKIYKQIPTIARKKNVREKPSS